MTKARSNAVANAAKGDLTVGTGTNLSGILPVSSQNGDTIVADSSTSTGLRYQGNFSAGKNLLINGDLGINQRAFTSNTTTNSFNFDRWSQINVGGGTLTTTPQVLAPATISGYGGTNYVRCVTASQSAAGDHAIYRYQGIEDVRLSAGQTITISFYAKAASGTPKIGIEVDQQFGSGGSASVYTLVGTPTISTSWTRYSATATLPSVSGKTIGAGNNAAIYFWISAGSTFNSRTGSIGNQNNTFEMTGFQFEISNTATAFQTATGTLQGELAACQRYYVRYAPSANNYAYFGNGTNSSTTNAYITIPLPVEMRVLPTSVDTTTAGNYRLQSGATAFSLTSLTIGTIGDGTKIGCLSATTSSGLTTGGFVQLLANFTTSAFVGFSAEL
jgi:hypothetical protein